MTRPPGSPTAWIGSRLPAMCSAHFLNRSYYDAEEIESMASQLDSLLALDTVDLELDELNQGDLVSEA